MRKDLGLSLEISRKWIAHLTLETEKSVNFSKVDYSIKKLMDSYLKLSSSKGKRPEDLGRFMECLFTIPDSDITDNIITWPDFSTSANTFSNPSPVSKKSNLRVNVTQTKLLMDS